MINKFIIQGMTCEACVKLITLKLNKLMGVQEIKIYLASGQTTVTAEREIDLLEIKQILGGTNYLVIKA
ncbi:MAG: hypothetical protein COX77_02645 [Candidatus Komeilibacteria bacterium CG_4_10_14_0_2_um_filter_37_10]|uniref:HMA domain-containing protein n=1 Tax=Candidatus Komeilibacteria bacterium CG_4_10_14_0_2_um_filter_37_10 TaxID=1974470 RepID=A0A2M7VF14_9BACT|nr:MAG: hypothetical protein COX77_02645 [Candidatus Komeilibacteria bacterium CG_4_10_14_0_2_um_filter_37_10]